MHGVFIQGICSKTQVLSQRSLERRISYASTNNLVEAFLATLVGGGTGWVVRLLQVQRVRQWVLLLPPICLLPAGSQLEIAAAFTELVQEGLVENEFNAGERIQPFA